MTFFSGEMKEPAKKKMKTLNMQDNKAEPENEEEDDGVGEKEEGEDEADVYQHIKKAKETDIQVMKILLNCSYPRGMLHLVTTVKEIRFSMSRGFRIHELPLNSKFPRKKWSVNYR